MKLFIMKKKLFIFMIMKKKRGVMAQIDIDPKSTMIKLYEYLVNIIGVGCLIVNICQYPVVIFSQKILVWEKNVILI